MSKPYSNRDPFRPVEPGLEVVVTRWLIPAFIAGVALPGLVALWVHMRRPPGPLTMSEIKTLDLTDAAAIALAVFDSTAVFTVALACLIVTLMKARPRHADSMAPPEA